jgi:TonB family protein
MAVHAALIGLLLWPQKPRAPIVEETPSKDTPVTFVNHGKPGKQPPRSEVAVADPDRKRDVRPPRRGSTPVPKAVPVESAPAVASAAVASEPDKPGEVAGEIGESVGGPGDSGGPGADGPSIGTGSGPIAFESQSMTPPQRLSGPDPRYTPQALEHEIEGTMQVRCIVGLDGQVSGCHALRSLPFMDREVIEALERRRYLPATIGGRAIAVEYVFRIELRLP